MKNNGLRLLNLLLVTMLFAVGALAKPSTTFEKIKPEVLVEKHLQSIGSPTALKSFKSIMAVGTSKAVFKGRGSGLTEGLCVLASQGKMNMIGMKFNNPDYQYETVGYDGKNFTIGRPKPGARSVLGGFLRLNQKTFKKGLLGGALSTSWELFNYDEKVGKLKQSGTSTIKGRKAYKFDYNLKKGSDLRVALFFDAETFRHVRTEYNRVFTSGLGKAPGNTRGVATNRVDNSAQQSETRHKMIEDFGDFRPENGLTLPHTYNLRLEILTGNGNTKDEWSMVLQKFYFNQNLGENQFRVDAY